MPSDVFSMKRGPGNNAFQSPSRTKESMMSILPQDGQVLSEENSWVQAEAAFSC